MRQTGVSAVWWYYLHASRCAVGLLHYETDYGVLAIT